MGLYIIRRLLLAIPTLLIISIVVFLILDLAPGDPTSQVPLTVPAEIRDNIRESLGLNDGIFVRWWSWNKLMVINEPIHLFEQLTNTCIGDCENRERIISWSSRSAAMDTIYERLPQTLWVLLFYSPSLSTPEFPQPIRIFNRCNKVVSNDQKKRP